jgi:hypothetical protein
MRSGVGCPRLLFDVLAARQFGCLPWEVRFGRGYRAPVFVQVRYMRVLQYEAETQRVLEDLPPDEPLIREW